MRTRGMVVLGAALGLLVTSNSTLMADIIMHRITTYYFDGPVGDYPGFITGNQILPVPFQAAGPIVAASAPPMCGRTFSPRRWGRRRRESRDGSLDWLNGVDNA